MTDPVFGDHPTDPQQIWDDGIRPSIADVDVIRWIGEAVSAEMVTMFESDWLTRWRRAVTTAEGAQLDARASELAFLCPAGWTEARCRAVLVAIYAPVFAQRTTARATAVADALLDVGQSCTYQDEFPCTGRFTFLATDADDAISYATALNRARPTACQFYIVAHDGVNPPFTIGTSQIGGPDTIGLMIGP